MEFDPSETLEIVERDSRSAESAARHAARATDVDDVVQDALLASLSGAPAQIDQRSAWVRTIARRCASRMFRRETIRRDSEVRYAESMEQAIGPAEPDEPNPALVRALSGLTDEYRTVIDLHYGQGLPLAEIARRAGVPGSTIRVRHSRALAQLRDSMGVRGASDRKARGFGLIGLLRALRDKRPAAAAALVVLPCAAILVWASSAAPPPLDATSTNALGRLADDTARATDPAQGPPAETPTLHAADARSSNERTALVEMRRIHLVGQDFEPVEGAAVYSMLTSDSMEPSLVARTDADGRAQFKAGLEWLFAEHPAHGRSWAVLAESDDREWNLRLNPVEAVVKGTVRHADGAPVEGARVRITTQGPHSPRRNAKSVIGLGAPVFVHTGPEGTFETRVRNTWLRLEAVAEYQGMRSTPAHFERPSACEIVFGDATAEPTEVQLIDASGSPLVGWSVFRRTIDERSGDPGMRAMAVLASFAPLVSDARGVIQLDGVRREGLQLVACAPHDQVGEVQAIRPAASSEPTWTIQGRALERRQVLVDAPAGAEIYVSGERLSRPLLALPVHGSTRYVVDPLPLGSIRIEGRDASGAPLRSEIVQLAAGEGPLRVELVSLEQHVLRVSVDGGRTAGTARVRIHPDPQAQVAGRYGDPEGHMGKVGGGKMRDVTKPCEFSVPGPGPFAVCVVHQDGRTGFASVDPSAAPGDVLDVEVELRDWPSRSLPIPFHIGRGMCAVEALDDRGELLWTKGPRVPKAGKRLRLPLGARAHSVRVTLANGDSFKFEIDGWPFGGQRGLRLVPRSSIRR